MMVRHRFITGFLILAAFLISVPSGACQQIIILNTTGQDFYSMEELRIGGDLDSNRLSISGSAAVISGEDVKVYILGKAQDILVHEMKVDGRDVPVSFDDRGYFMVLSRGEFDFTGSLEIRTRGQVRLFVPGPVNELRFDIENGYAIHGDQYGLLDRQVIIQRSREAAMLSEGSFKYTYAERNTFFYDISYSSFGSSLGKAVIRLNNGENVLSVSGANDHSISGRILTLELEGEKARVIVTGTFASNNIVVPLDEARHHVLIESDPEKMLTISTQAEEIDLTQSTLTPSYHNARAFIASKSQPISVTIQGLGTFPSLAASVSRATNRIAITEKGGMLALLTYAYSNTGMDYLRLDAPGTPLYAGTGYRNPVKLTQLDDSLYLAFPKVRSGTIEVIYFDTRKPLGIVDRIELPLANTDLAITEAVTEIILPGDYMVVWTEGAQGGTELPAFDNILILALFFAGCGYLLLGRPTFAVSYLVFCAGLLVFSPLLLAFFIIFSIGLAAKRHMSEGSLKWMLAGAAAFVAFSVALALILGVLAGFGVYSSMGSRSDVTFEKSMVAMDSNAPVSEAMTRLGGESGSITVPVREGVMPVKLELPALGKTMRVSTHLVHKDEPLKMAVWVVHDWLRYPLYIVAIIFGVSALRMYKKKQDSDS